MRSAHRHSIPALFIAFAACTGADRSGGDDVAASFDGGADDTGTQDAGFVRDAGTRDAGFDKIPPRVTATTPADDAVDVPSGSTSIRIEFDESMDQTSNLLTARIVGAMTGGETNLNVVYDSNGTSASMTATLPAASRISIDLQGQRDLAGNPLTQSTALPDGILDFRTR